MVDEEDALHAGSQERLEVCPVLPGVSDVLLDVVQVAVEGDQLLVHVLLEDSDVLLEGDHDGVGTDVDVE